MADFKLPKISKGIYAEAIAFVALGYGEGYNLPLLKWTAFVVLIISSFFLAISLCAISYIYCKAAFADTHNKKE